MYGNKVGLVKVNASDNLFDFFGKRFRRWPFSLQFICKLAEKYDQSFYLFSKEFLNVILLHARAIILKAISSLHEPLRYKAIPYLPARPMFGSDNFGCIFN